MTQDNVNFITKNLDKNLLLIKKWNIDRKKHSFGKTKILCIVTYHEHFGNHHK
ncbi:hypothetical protein V757_12295 [Pelistega indica]|uniref:Uncharacterized protein n=1 Tax=Pelistega indica TaxID=1414851 RepID=V8FTC4_9BURK|nr:hypothetical protein V757_12295 [Pelistega indica]